MIPVLVVEGVAKEVVEITFRNKEPFAVMTRENCSCKTYFDNSVDTYTESSLKVDLKDSLRWTGRYDEPYETIHSLIKDNEKELLGLSTKIADAVVETPFVPPSLIEDYKKLKQRILGLIDARDILEDSMMVEDVDLSGGEEIND